MKTQLKIAAALVVGFAFQANAFADNKGRGGNNQGSNAKQMSQVQNNVKVSQQTNNQKFVNNNKFVINDPIKKGPDQFKKAPIDQVKKGPDQFKKAPDQFKKGPDQFKNGNGGIVKKPNGPQNNQFKSYGKYTACKTFNDYKGPCYKGQNCHFWTSTCWNQAYGCNTYWCPTNYCYFYWCQPHGCYLPVEYVPCGVYAFAY